MTTVYDPMTDGKNWQKYGACTLENSLLFEPTSETSTDPATVRQIAQAKTVCARCPVIEMCLRDALTQRDVTGIRGGLTGPEREVMMRASSRGAVIAKIAKQQETAAAAGADPAAVESEFEVLTDAERRRQALPSAVVAEQRRRTAANQRAARARKAGLNTDRAEEVA